MANPKTPAAPKASLAGAGNGGILFEKMPSTFTIPARTVGGGIWDTVVDQLQQKENKGQLIKLFESPKESPDATYMRAKALRAAIKRKNLSESVTVVVRVVPATGKSTLFAQAD